MFDEVTKKEGGKRAARRSAFVAGSSVVQLLLVVFIIVMGERIRAAVKSEPVVEVKFVKSVAPPPPPPPPPPPAAKKRPPSDKPKTDVVRPPPTAMIQPKDVVEEAKANPNEPEDEDYGDGEGVEGGVVGGVVGGQRGPQQVEEAPRYMTSGFKAPQLAEKSCISENLRIPSQLAGFVSGPITVKFAVYASAAVSDVQIMAQLPDPRIGEAIKNAIRGCQWIPGADAQGKPTSIWVIMPIRFAGN